MGLSGNRCPWLAFADKIENITIGDTVQIISAGAFENLPNLKTVQIGAAVTEIGENAFRGTGLTEITVPDNVKTIGLRAFMDTPLKTAVLGAGMESVGTQAFGLCPDLETVEFTSNPILLEHWDERIFTADENRNAPANLTVTAPYGGYAWAYATHRDINWTESGTLPVIESGTCGDQLTWTLYEGAVFVLDGKGHMEKYWGIKDGMQILDSPWKHLDGQIRLLHIGEYVYSISNGAFSGIQSLQYLYYEPYAGEHEDHYKNGEYRARLGNNAFRETGLIQIETPDYELYNSFAGCSQLEFVKFGKGNVWLGGGQFYGCSSLQVLDLSSNADLPEKNGYSIFSQMSGSMGMIPENLTVYAMPGSRMEAFCKENNINFVGQSDDYDADMIGRCGDNAAWLLDREKKTLVIYSDDMHANSSEKWGRTWDFDFDAKQPEFYIYRDEIEHLVVNDGVRYIGNSLFQGLTSLKTVEGHLEKMGYRTFYGCTSLEQVELGGLYSSNMGMEVFMNCTSLKKFVCSYGNGRLPTSTFAGCTALESVYFYNYTSFEDGIFDPIDLTDKIDHDYTQHVTVYVFKGSGAEAQAQKNGIPYEYIE